MMDSQYIGEELDLFSHAINWKRYYGKLIQKYLGDHILEVGAGIGATTKVLCTDTHSNWVCLEPDQNLLSQIQQDIIAGILPPFCTTIHGETSDLLDKKTFDSIIYIDVLEHIENDDNELLTASKLLKTGGYLIVLSPAFNFLYSPFDKSIGHYRRYNKKMITNFEIPNLSLQKVIYLDSVGLLTSLANKFFLKQKYPTLNQILFWDRRIIPITKIIDRILFFSVGRSILSIWRHQKE